jgi:putative restriction endonuclease
MSNRPNISDVRERFRKLSVWKRGEKRAPHKPLLVLYALAKVKHGVRWISFEEVKQDVGDLLEEFGPPRQSHHPEYPFWYLRNDDVWTVEDAEELPRRSNNKEPLVGAMLARDTHGGFTNEVWDALRNDEQLRRDVAQMLLHEHFPPTLHEDILNAVGLKLTAYRMSRRVQRDPQFRNNVLRAYDFRCAVCGFDLELDESPIGLEAAHIMWKQAGGPDEISNGISLCVLHHKMLDKGVIHINSRLTVQIAEGVKGSKPHLQRLERRHGNQIYMPQRTEYTLEDSYVTWHVKEVFRGSPYSD